MSSANIEHPFACLMAAYQCYFSPHFTISEIKIETCLCSKIHLSKPVWTFVFQVEQTFSSCAYRLSPSLSQAEVLSDLVVLFLLF
jgi:hypothetical protein